MATYRDSSSRLHWHAAMSSSLAGPFAVYFALDTMAPCNALSMKKAKTSCACIKNLNLHLSCKRVAGIVLLRREGQNRCGEHQQRSLRRDAAFCSHLYIYIYTYVYLFIDLFVFFYSVYTHDSRTCEDVGSTVSAMTFHHMQGKACSD